MTEAQALGALPAFRECDRTDLDAFVRVAPPARFAAGAVMIDQGKTAEGALLLVSGRCRAEVQSGDRRMIVGHVGPGELIGELGLFTEGLPRSATVVAEDDVVALRLAPAILDEPRASRVMHVVEQRALATLSERVRRSTGNVRRCDEEVDDEPSASFVAGFMRSLRKLLGG